MGDAQWQTISLYGGGVLSIDDVKVELIKYPTDEDWLLCRNMALNTIGKESSKEVTSEWKSMILRSEHSPIRSLWFTWKWENLPYWVSTHFVRHHVGVNHFISSQRNDRQKLYDRNDAPQASPISHVCVANAQAIINISKVRCCFQASPETRHAWQLALNEVQKVCPELYDLAAPSCVYRNGLCPEPRSCGWNKSAQFNERLVLYRTQFGA